MKGCRLLKKILSLLLVVVLLLSGTRLTSYAFENGRLNAVTLMDYNSGSFPINAAANDKNNELSIWGVIWGGIGYIVGEVLGVIVALLIDVLDFLTFGSIDTEKWNFLFGMFFDAAWDWLGEFLAGFFTSK